MHCNRQVKRIARCSEPGQLYARTHFVVSSTASTESSGFDEEVFAALVQRSFPNGAIDHFRATKDARSTTTEAVTRDTPLTLPRLFPHGSDHLPSPKFNLRCCAPQTSERIPIVKNPPVTKKLLIHSTDRDRGYLNFCRRWYHKPTCAIHADCKNPPNSVCHSVIRRIPFSTKGTRFPFLFSRRREEMFTTPLLS